MKVSGGEKVKSCGIQPDPNLTLDLGIARFRFRRAVDFAIKQVFAFVIIHQGHERKEINLCLAAFIDPPLEN